MTDRRLKESNAKSWYDAPTFAAYPLPLDKSKFANPDNDPRGLWKGDPFDAPAVRANLTYVIKNPSTGEEHLPPDGRHWRTEEKQYKELLADNRIVFGKNGDAKPQLKVFYEEKREFGSVENTWLTGKKAGTATHGTKEIQALFDGKAVFDYPKPSTLIKTLLRIATRHDDLIVDFFAGSASTAHATLDLNREDGGTRKFLLVQFPENTPDESTAKKEGFETISQISEERIKRVIDSLAGTKDGTLGLETRSKPEDLGLKVFKLGISNYRPWNGVEENDPEKYVDQLEAFADPLVVGWSKENVIYEVALKEGYSLNIEISDVAYVKENKILKVYDPDKDQSFLICLDDKINPETPKSLKLTKKDLFVCRDIALSDELAANLALQCKLKVI
jgi:adenine-specific DNA-methyltransferase